MKIRVIDRIVLFLLALIMLIAGVCAALKEFGISAVGMIVNLIPEDLMPELTANVVLIGRIAAIAVVILLSFYLFSVSFRRKKKPAPFIDMESGSKGRIRMSMESISGLVLRTCADMPGINGLKVATINHEDSVSVDMAFQVEATRNIPEISALLQEMVGDVVEKNCGVAVRNVCVTVTGFTAPAQRALPEAENAPKRGRFLRDKKQEIAAESTEVAPETAAPVIMPEPAEEAQETEPVSEEIIVSEPEQVATAAEPEAEAAVETEEAAPVEAEAKAQQSDEPEAADEPVVEDNENDEFVLMENE